MIASSTGISNFVSRSVFLLLKRQSKSVYMHINFILISVQISEWKSVDLRVLPVGVDRNGLAYWCQLDAEFNLRLYGGEQDDNSGATWQLRAK